MTVVTLPAFLASKCVPIGQLSSSNFINKISPRVQARRFAERAFRAPTRRVCMNLELGSAAFTAITSAALTSLLPAASVLTADNIEGDVQLYFRIFLGGLGIIASGFVGALVIGSATGGSNLSKLEENYQKTRAKQLEINVDDLLEQDETNVNNRR